MASNLTLSYPNRCDECNITDANPSIWSSKLPLDNLHNKVLKKVARTNVGNRSAELQINLLYEPREIGVVALANHNFTTSAKVRIIGYSQYDCTGLVRFDSGSEFRAWAILNPTDNGVIPFESKNWFLGTVEESQRKDYTSLVTYFADDNQMCRSFKIIISDPATVSAASNTSNTIGLGALNFTVGAGLGFYAGQKITLYQTGTPHNYVSGLVTNYNPTTGALTILVNERGGSGTINTWSVINGDNYLQFGRLFLGRTIEPNYNTEYGDLSQGYTDLTEIDRAIDNTKYPYKRPKMRTISAVLKHLNKQEAFSGFYDAQREVGLSGELLYAFSKPEYIGNINMTKDKNFYAQTFLCNFSELNPIDFAYVNGFSTALKLEEIV